jgi:hypothetical protein
LKFYFLAICDHATDRSTWEFVSAEDLSAFIFKMMGEKVDMAGTTCRAKDKRG